MAAEWIDLLDPTEAELTAAAPETLEESALELLLAPPQHDDEPRPTLWSHGDYVFGVFLVAVAVPEENCVYYQEIGLVLTPGTILTVRKTPSGGRPPYPLDSVRKAVQADDVPGMVAYRLIDDIAERYLDIVDALDAEVDELEDRVDTQGSEVTRTRISELRHDMLHIRRTLAPTRDAVRRVIMNTVEVSDGAQVFPSEVEIAFNAVYDKLMRAVDGLDLTRDLLASVRDYYQSKISIDQNEVMKRLTVIASLVLFPTFVVGLYGQNFVNIPELRWHYGYAYVWGVILVSTLAQLWFFKRRNWF
ncbi:MAG TPA: magnesium transporter CorA family protein [Gaiellaceae bacterium]|nr:magnesium transporter CorA family protein [Gaiellaceae bacterium]